MPAAQQQNEFCHSHVVTDDGAVVFKCSDDAAQYPWLKLHPANNTAIQATNYFSLSSMSVVRGAYKPGEWTALTKFQWRVYQMGADARHPSHGAADPKNAECDLDYAATFFDARGELLYRVRGEGVVFRNRDFEAWRAKAKAEAMALPEPKDFTFAPSQAVGAGTPVECFVGQLMENDGGQYCDGLITAETGFPPAHPYHDGSGDHVNSGHMLDAAQQAAMLMRGDVSYPVAGSVIFKKYVELGRTFTIRLVSRAQFPDKLSLIVEQGPSPCAEIEFDYEQ